MRYVGVDYGTKRIGLALGDDAVGIAFPAEVITSTGTPASDAQAVARWARENDGQAFVVGMPLNMDGTVGPQAQRVAKFVAALQAASKCTVETWDERLSSFAADAALRAAGFARPKQSGKRDAVAAQVILTDFLRAKNTPPPPTGVPDA